MVLAPCRECGQRENVGYDWLYFGSKNFNWHKYESDLKKWIINA